MAEGPCGSPPPLALVTAWGHAEEEGAAERVLGGLPALVHVTVLPLSASTGSTQASEPLDLPNTETTDVTTDGVKVQHSPPPSPRPAPPSALNLRQVAMAMKRQSLPTAAVDDDGDDDDDDDEACKTPPLEESISSVDSSISVRHIAPEANLDSIKVTASMRNLRNRVLAYELAATVQHTATPDHQHWWLRRAWTRKLGNALLNSLFSAALLASALMVIELPPEDADRKSKKGKQGEGAADENGKSQEEEESPVVETIRIKDCVVSPFSLTLHPRLQIDFLIFFLNKFRWLHRLICIIIVVQIAQLIMIDVDKYTLEEYTVRGRLQTVVAMLLLTTGSFVVSWIPLCATQRRRVWVRVVYNSTTWFVLYLLTVASDICTQIQFDKTWAERQINPDQVWNTAVFLACFLVGPLVTIAAPMGFLVLHIVALLLLTSACEPAFPAFTSSFFLSYYPSLVLGIAASYIVQGVCVKLFLTRKILDTQAAGAARSSQRSASGIINPEASPVAATSVAENNTPPTANTNTNTITNTNTKHSSSSTGPDQEELTWTHRLLAGFRRTAASVWHRIASTRIGCLHSFDDDANYKVEQEFRDTLSEGQYFLVLNDAAMVAVLALLAWRLWFLLEQQGEYIMVLRAYLYPAADHAALFAACPDPFAASALYSSWYIFTCGFLPFVLLLTLLQLVPWLWARWRWREVIHLLIIVTYAAAYTTFILVFVASFASCAFPHWESRPSDVKSASDMWSFLSRNLEAANGWGPHDVYLQWETQVDNLIRYATFRLVFQTVFSPHLRPLPKLVLGLLMLALDYVISFKKYMVWGTDTLQDRIDKRWESAFRRRANVLLLVLVPFILFGVVLDYFLIKSHRLSRHCAAVSTRRRSRLASMARSRTHSIAAAAAATANAAAATANAAAAAATANAAVNDHGHDQGAGDDQAIPVIVLDSSPSIPPPPPSSSTAAAPV